ncbi:formate/nitrite transporter family protein [Lacrimispora xylanisolvens]|uniref:formate/nitrite transporter family protein n=1 Tax=Lacrimispora xylanisolvens TaxID=384636 RepID=UPI003D9C7EF7
MFQEEYSMLAKAAENKSKFLKKNPVGYWVAAMLAGIYVGFGILLIFSAGGMISSQPYVKIIMGASFGIALSLVVMAGAELFTGNNLVMAGGMFSGTVTLGEAVKLWVVCLLGNWAGSILLALIFWGAGLAKGPVGEFMANAAAAKNGNPLHSSLFQSGTLQHLSLSCYLVQLPLQIRERKINHGVLVSFCVYNKRL